VGFLRIVSDRSVKLDDQRAVQRRERPDYRTAAGLWSVHRQDRCE
jgi:hypothetical protein